MDAPYRSNYGANMQSVDVEWILKNINLDVFDHVLISTTYVSVQSNIIKLSVFN